MVVRKEGKKLEQNIIPVDFVGKVRHKNINKYKKIITDEEMSK
jgi:hypothetical protein